MKAIESIGKVEFDHYPISRHTRKNQPAEWIADSQPPGIPTPTWWGWKYDFRRLDPKSLVHLDAKRLSEKPIAIGRTSPDFLLSAKRRPSKNTGATPVGQRPARTKLMNPVRAAITHFRAWGNTTHFQNELKETMCNVKDTILATLVSCVTSYFQADHCRLGRVKEEPSGIAGERGRMSSFLTSDQQSEYCERTIM